MLSGTGTLTPVATDRPVALDEDVQNDAVDLVVRRRSSAPARSVRSVSEPVDTALALLMSGRIPGEVIVDHRLEVLLEVDTFRQTVGRDKDVSPRLGREFVDALHLVHWAGECRSLMQRRCSSRGVAQMLGDVVRGVDELAEDDRVQALWANNSFDLGRQQRELGVVLRSGQLLGLASEGTQPRSRSGEGTAGRIVIDGHVRPGVMSLPSTPSSSAVSRTLVRPIASTAAGFSAPATSARDRMV